MHGLLPIAIAGQMAISLALTPAQQPATVSSPNGTWSGDVTITTPDGHTEKAKGLLWLSVRGTKLSGALGETPEHLESINGGSFNQNVCRFGFPFHEKSV